MRGLDTNVLVRYLVRDDPHQASAVERLVQEALHDDACLLVNVIVLCETVWVLEAGYGYSGPVVGDTIEKLLVTRQLEFEARDDVWRALHRYRERSADLAEYLIGQRDRSNGCAETLTFNRALHGDEHFRVLE
ncbi:MAG: PIN domain-containing protein [bacterium]